ALSWIERFARRDPAQPYRMARWRLMHNPSTPASLHKRLDRIARTLDRPKTPDARPPAFRPRVVFALCGVLVGAVLAPVLAILSLFLVLSGDLSGLVGILIAAAITVGVVALERWGRGRRGDPTVGYRPFWAPLRPRELWWFLALGLGFWAAPEAAF